MNAHSTHQMGESFTFYYTKQAELSVSEASERKQIPFQSKSTSKESVLWKWTKYGNLSDKRGVLAAPFQMYTFLFKKNMLFFTIQWLGGVKLHYISLFITQIWTHL